MEYTKEIIQDKLATDQRWLERGILAIYNYQTSHEQSRGDTIELNGVGFNGCDAPFLSSLACWIQKSYRPEGQRLSAKQASFGAKKMKKYAGQLLRIISEQQ